MPDTSVTLTEAQVADLCVSYARDKQTYSAQWTHQTNDYAAAWYQFSGEVFDQKLSDATGNTTRSDKGSEELLYPLRINKVKMACIMHGVHLWGQYQGDEILDFTVQSKHQGFEAATERADKVKQFYRTMVQKVLTPSVLREQGRLFQIYGGAYFRVFPDPNSPLGVNITPYAPEYVFPVWHPGDYRKLLHVHVVYSLDVATATELYGYRPTVKTGATTVEVHETWNRDSYVMLVGEQIAVDVLGTGNPITGRLNLKVGDKQTFYTPWLYIPRLRTGRFWGESLALDLAGLSEEINLSTADAGDAVNSAAHLTMWGRNLTRAKTGQALRPASGEIFDAGETMAGGPDPHIEAFAAPAISGGISEHSTRLDTQFREVASLSPVMFGDDEGSQRSGVTLAMRALPTTSIIDDYRGEWAQGVRDMGELSMILVQQEPDLNFMGVEADWLGHEVTVGYGPVLPRDREALVNEQVVLTGAGIRSMELAISLLPDVPNVAVELDHIKKEAAEEAAKKFKEQRQAAELQSKIRQEEQAQQQKEQASQPKPTPVAKESSPKEKASASD